MKNANRITAAVLLSLCIYFFIESGNFTSFGLLFPRVIVGTRVFEFIASRPEFCKI